MSNTAKSRSVHLRVPMWIYRRLKGEADGKAVGVATVITDVLKEKAGKENHDESGNVHVCGD